MSCIRCQSDDDRPEIEKRDRDQIMHGSCQADQGTSDIGGFAEIAGCLDKLKRSEKQVGGIHSIISDSFLLPFCFKANVSLWRIFR